MQIPKTFKVGRTRYHVQTAKRVGRSLRGIVYYNAGVVRLSTHTRDGLPRPETELTQTFWHEAMHTVLRDMGHRLNTDEKFVDDVAHRLTQIVNSARF